ncbi:MAG: FIST N-terminal domain-containing protein [Sediminibacterium sp.]|nr:FIST N-terminal domain-containing protein [Sediminibacterium sp.]
MKIKQYYFALGKWNSIDKNSVPDANLILIFGSRLNLLESDLYLEQLKESFPKAHIVSCSTSGNIMQDRLTENSITASAIEMEATSVKTYEYDIKGLNAYILGAKIAASIQQENLNSLLVLLDAGEINGGYLMDGFNSVYEGKIPIFGGFAGDDVRFEKQVVGLNSLPSSNKIVLVAFYGSNLKVSHGSKGGWEVFGPERIVTKSEAQKVFELDGKKILSLYKEYLGDKAKDLPSSALLYPICIKDKTSNELVVRTIQALNEEEQSISFFSNVPKGSIIQLMRASFDKLIDGAGESANESLRDGMANPDFALLISCVGRKLVLGPKTEDEIYETIKVLGSAPRIAGFYSYGELSPVVGDKSCKLHNQTMTITTFKEVV